MSYKKTILILTALTLLINLLSITNLNLFSDIVVTANEANKIKIISINLNSGNYNYAKVSSYIGKEAPDVLVLIELTNAWSEFINQNIQGYPHRELLPRDNNFGIGILSRIKILNSETFFESWSQAPIVKSNISFNNTTINIVAAHAFPPIGFDGSKARNDYLNLMTNVINSTSSPTVLCGDLNITPMSLFFKSLLSNLTLKWLVYSPPQLGQQVSH